MYIPADFLEQDRDRLAALMAAHSFALLVTTDDQGVPFATHLPLIYEADAGDHGRLVGHMARANPQWRHFESNDQVLAIFWGPHAYVSPGWYETHPSVPTWNYATVHACGRPRLLDAADVRPLLETLVETYESGSEQPWQMDLPDKYERMMIRGIVAFEIVVERIDGKFKLSQNRDQTDRGNVAAELERSGFDDARGIAALMREREAAG